MIHLKDHHRFTGSYKPPETIHLGYCENCQEEITTGNCHLEWDDVYFCDRDCFLKFMGVKEVG